MYNICFFKLMWKNFNALKEHMMYHTSYGSLYTNNNVVQEHSFCIFQKVVFFFFLPSVVMSFIVDNIYWLYTDTINQCIIISLFWAQWWNLGFLCRQPVNRSLWIGPLDVEPVITLQQEQKVWRNVVILHFWIKRGMSWNDRVIFSQHKHIIKAMPSKCILNMLI